MGSSLKNITVPEGRDVVLSCTVKNLDGHKVAWIHYDRYDILILFFSLSYKFEFRAGLL